MASSNRLLLKLSEHSLVRNLPSRINLFIIYLNGLQLKESLLQLKYGPFKVLICNTSLSYSVKMLCLIIQQQICLNDFRREVLNKARSTLSLQTPPEDAVQTSPLQQKIPTPQDYSKSFEQWPKALYWWGLLTVWAVLFCVPFMY